MFSKSPPRVAIDIDDHRRRTYVWLRRLLVIVTSIFLLALASYRAKNMMNGKPNAENSISAYYYHDNQDWPMRDLFVGSLCAMGLMLLAYQGFRDAEDYALNFAGIFLVGVAFVPMEAPAGKTSWVAVPEAHYASAAIFFLSIIYVTWFRSHDTLGEITGERRTKYKNAYRLTGLFMTLVLIGTGVAASLHRADRTRYGDYLLWAEFFGVFAFWLFWLVKTVELENSKVDDKTQSELKPSTYDPPGEPPVE